MFSDLDGIRGFAKEETAPCVAGETRPEDVREDTLVIEPPLVFPSFLRLSPSPPCPFFGLTLGLLPVILPLPLPAARCAEEEVLETLDRRRRDADEPPESFDTEEGLKGSKLVSVDDGDDTRSFFLGGLLDELLDSLVYPKKEPSISIDSAARCWIYYTRKISNGVPLGWNASKGDKLRPTKVLQSDTSFLQ